jgi:lipopolysaccharide/colanic/teichoic acid biosynthesis glycosyltransferase
MIRAFNSVVHVRILTLFLSETIIIFACFLAAVYADPDLESAPIFLIYDAGLIRTAVVVGIILLGLYFRDFYTQLRIPSRIFLFQELCLIFGLSFVGQGLLSYIHRDWTIPRKIMLGGSALALLCMFGWRLLFDIAARGAVQPKPVLFLGLSPTVVQLAGHFEQNPEFGLKPIGYLAGMPGGATTTGATTIAGMPRLGSLSDLSAVLDATRPSSVVIGKREDIKPWWTNEFLELRFSGVDAEQAATLYERTFGRVCAAEIWPSKMIFGDTWKVKPIDITIQTWYSMLIAGLAIVILLPIMALIAISIRLGSKGPVMLQETRIGMHNRPFTMFRFRARPGGFLRRFHLDALPQLFNVIRGDMAIVGPEPDRPAFAQWLSERISFYRHRQEVKPGLTGWAKIHYDTSNSGQDVLRRLEYDLYYVKKLSPAMDSLILLLSIKIAIFGE